MKRFHVHVSVKDLSQSIGFYSKLFAAEPSVTRPDYAKWMLDDPRVNFAISQRGHATGVNHLGLQVDTADELGELRAAADAAGIDATDERAAACCYARSDKHWIQDPQGIAWETFHTLGSIPVFGEDAEPAKACCTPLAKQPGDKADAACCVPAESKASSASCCA